MTNLNKQNNNFYEKFNNIFYIKMKYGNCMRKKNSIIWGCDFLYMKYISFYDIILKINPPKKSKTLTEVIHFKIVKYVLIIQRKEIISYIIISVYS